VAILARPKGLWRFFAYDPQLDRVVDLNADLPDVIREYGRVVAKIPEIIEQGKSHLKRPWWKFWYERFPSPRFVDNSMFLRIGDTPARSAIARSVVSSGGRRG
jgi:hypothetical protein